MLVKYKYALNDSIVVVACKVVLDPNLSLSWGRFVERGAYFA